MNLYNLKTSLGLTFALFFFVGSSLADQDLFEKSGWEKLQEIESPPATSADGNAPSQLFEIAPTKIDQKHHLIGGEVRYSDVGGTGYLEMWTHYSSDRQYFSRTLSAEGPTGKLSGTSDWRPFSLPFFGKADEFPSKLQINAVLPDGGTLEIRNVALYEKGGAVNSWWGKRNGNVVGGTLGAIIGVIGSLIGVLSGLGKARGFVMPLVVIGASVGAIVVSGGIFAVSLGQPYHVWYPMVLLGGILAAVLGGSYYTIRNRYTERELRKISAQS